MILVDECSTTFDQSNPAPPKRGCAHDRPEPEFSFRGARLIEPINRQAPKLESSRRGTFKWMGAIKWIAGSGEHCPADKKLFSGKSSHITPGDDTWLARLLRRRLEQDVHETPPEPDTRRKTGREKPHLFFDEWLPDSPLVVKHSDGSTSRVALTIPTAKRFRGVAGKPPFDQILSELKNAPASWVYPLDRYEIDNREVDSEVFPLLVDGGCVHTILHKIDGMNIKQHGLTGWVRLQDKPAVDQAETILFGKEYKNLHDAEAEQVKRSHTIKSKRNTGGPRPEGAIEDKDDYLRWMVDKGQAKEKTDEEVEQEFADRLKELQRIDDPIDSFDQPAGPLSGMEWDGDSFVVNDDHPEYFEGRIIPERKRLTGEERRVEFNDHKALVEAGAVDLREDELILEVKLDYRTREEVAEQLGISVDALDKRIQRRSLEARAMQDGKYQIPYLALTYEQAADIADNNAVYLQVDLNGWRWYKLDVEKHGSVAQATEGLKRAKMSEALRQHKKSKAASRAAGRHGTNERYPEWTIALKEVKDRYDKQVFHPDRIRILQRPPRPKQPWEGLIGDAIGDE